jgi:DNA-binding MarR family transcriptional regulator/GNAT superfamily N-acetyltransferase
MEPAIPSIRSFHRVVTLRTGALNNRYLGRNRPLGESRLLFEIGTAGAAVRQLRARLGLDSGFLSRMLRSLESVGLITTAKRAGDDGRVKFARLTRAGRTELRRLNELSDELARSILAPLSAQQADRLVVAMVEVERLLRASAVVVDVEKPSKRDAVWCLEQYFHELDGRFRTGFDPRLSISAAPEEMTPPSGYFVMARLFAEPIGCGALKITSRDIGEVKRMWVAAPARNLGVGRRILGEIEHIARRRKLKLLRLETNESLTEAQALYRASGYREVDAFNDEPYAHHWFEKRLR